ncbi:MAG TPA: Stp1/IreP family PP2C-type Ser/Thr phosphatase [Candidatus Kapabacteria bacterium]|nr:Stp1/IreP family PP2C-type Ser/Thr phosphatase [Candidatus Kapabacteria bacterium]
MTTNDQAAGGSDGRGYEVATGTHIGLVRSQNEDYLGVQRTRNGLLLVVCDGMGGHRGGARASRIAVETAIADVEEGSGSAGELLRHAVMRANDAIVKEAVQDGSLKGMGTTLVAALLSGEDATIANVGDSRAYLLPRSGAMERLTADHSLVGEMVQRGELSEDEAARHPRRNVITRALGTPGGIEPDIFRRRLAAGDTLLLCSDGLHGLVNDAVITELLRRRPVAGACDALVERALAEGGTDNVTAVVALASSADEPRDATTDPGKEVSAPARRRPRGLGLIIGVAFGTIAVVAGLIIFWRWVMISMEGRDTVKRDSIARALQQGVPPDSSMRIFVDDSTLRRDSAQPRNGGAPQSGQQPHGPQAPHGAQPDSVRPGDQLRW